MVNSPLIRPYLLEGVSGGDSPQLALNNLDLHKQNSVDPSSLGPAQTLVHSGFHEGYILKSPFIK